MGGSSYSDDLYTAKNVAKRSAGVPTFDHHAAVASGAKPAAVHENLNIYGKVREARDSDAHPESLAIMYLFDVTGSMAEVPSIVQKKIPQLMGVLLRKGYVAHPQVLFGAIGDATCDKVPLQIGQFESGVEMDDDITKIYLEGGGGGQVTESYELALYYAAFRTSADCWEKRGKKGYLFLTGDEKPYDTVSRHQVQKLMGVQMEADMPIEEVVRAAQEKFHVFFIIPGHTSHGKDPQIKKRWVELLGGENVLLLPDENAVAEVVAGAIGMCEGTTDMARFGADLHDVGSGHVAHAATNALAPLAASAALAKTGEGDLPEGSGAGTARL